MDAKNHPTVRRGTGWLRHQPLYLAVILVVVGIALLLDPTALHILGGVGCIAAAGLSVYLGEKQVKSLRHEYRYEDEKLSGS